MVYGRIASLFLLLHVDMEALAPILDSRAPIVASRLSNVVVVCSM